MRSTIILLILIATFAACSKKTDNKTESVIETVSKKDVEVQLIYCYSCHNPKAESHDGMLAPPMVAVKKRYLMSYPEKEAFVNAVSAHAADPKEETVLMRGALQQYGMMAKAPFSEEQLKQIATYFFEHELEKPEWFDEHEQQMHGDGVMGMGMGMGGAGMGRGMGKGRMMQDTTSN